MSAPTLNRRYSAWAAVGKKSGKVLRDDYGGQYARVWTWRANR